MPRTADDSRRAEARRLYALGVRAEVIGAQLGVGRRTVQRWCADIIRPRGPRKRADVPDSRVVALIDQGISQRGAAAVTGMSRSGVRNRYQAAKGGRPDRARQADGDG